MLRKTIQASLIVMLMTEGVFAQLPPGVHLKRDKPEPTNLKKEHQKAWTTLTDPPLRKFQNQKRMLIRGATFVPLDHINDPLCRVRPRLRINFCGPWRQGPLLSRTRSHFPECRLDS
jgi:hypothetical protein